MTLRIYEKPACVQCTMTKRKAGWLGLEFELDDITEPGNLAAALALGIAAAPVVIATYPDGSEDVWGGFQPDRLDAYAAALAEVTR